MKKETVIAILLGIGAGVLIALWVIRGTQSNSKGDSQVVMDEKITPSVSISNSMSEPLLITKPEDGFLSTSDTITITGTTKKGSLIVVQSPVEEITQKASSNNFSIKIKLMNGANNILVTSYNEKTIETLPMTIYYVTEQ